MEPRAGEEARLKRSRTEVEQERRPTSGCETLPAGIVHPAIALTPALSQSLSVAVSSPLSSGSKRKRTSRPTSMPEAEREAGLDNEMDLGAGLDNEMDLGASLDNEMGNGWSEQAYEGEDTDEFDRGYVVEGQIDERVIDGFLHGEENRQFRSEVWNEFTKICRGGVVVKGYVDI